MSNIATQIKTIADHPGKKDKERLVAEYATHPVFKEILVWAYDPFIRFGVKQIPAPPSSGSLAITEVWHSVCEVLDGLATRRYTGHNALSEITSLMTDLLPEDQELFANIIKKDLRAGFGDSTINKACKGLIPTMPYMRCSLPKDAKFDKFTWEEGCFSQEKADGMFANINLSNGVVEILGRSGLAFPVEEFDWLADDVRLTFDNNTQTHGELLVYKAGELLPRAKANGILNSVLQGGSFESDEKPIFVAWDQIPLDRAVPKGKYDVPYKTRFKSLVEQCPRDHLSTISIVNTRVVHSLKEAYAHSVELMKAGKEGSVVKNGDAPWKDGTSTEQIKLKLEFGVELRLKGFNAGNGKFADTFGSMVFESEEGFLEVGVSGISDDLRNKINRDREGWLNSICTVLANDITYSDDGGKHSLFLPRFSERRYDKFVADTFSKIEEQLEAAKDGNLCVS